MVITQPTRGERFFAALLRVVVLLLVSEGVWGRGGCSAANPDGSEPKWQGQGWFVHHLHQHRIKSDAFFFFFGLLVHHFNTPPL